jgi:hypothetical protein
MQKNEFEGKEEEESKRKEKEGKIPFISTAARRTNHGHDRNCYTNEADKKKKEGDKTANARGLSVTC